MVLESGGDGFQEGTWLDVQAPPAKVPSLELSIDRNLDLSNAASIFAGQEVVRETGTNTCNQSN